MATVKVSALPSEASLSGSEEILINDGGTSKKSTVTAVRTGSYTLPEATTTVRGGIELFSDTDQSVAATAVSTTAARTYGLQINSSGQGVVNVPWTDTSGSNVTSNGLWEHDATIGTNYVMAAGNNAISAGPITIDTGVSVTVTGSWVIA